MKYLKNVNFDNINKQTIINKKSKNNHWTENEKNTYTAYWKITKAMTIPNLKIIKILAK